MRIARRCRLLLSVCLSMIVLAGFGCSTNPLPGTIVVDPQHPAWLTRAHGKPLFMCGPGDPEGFLYRGHLRPDGTRDGDQMELIQKLAGTGANCIYLMAVRSHGGDGDRTHNPFIDHDPKKPLNPRVLDQWDTWFTAMDREGIIIFFFLYDDGSAPFGKLPADGRLSPAETAFIDGLVSRFSRYRNLIWCVAEEYAEKLTRDHVARIAERIREKDPNRHPIALHQNAGTEFDFAGTTTFDQFAVQCNVDTPKELHDSTVAACKNVQGLININMSEFGDSHYESEPSSGSGDALRKKVWAIAMGGGYSMILGMDIATTPQEDLLMCGRLVRFMESTRFNLTSPHDELAREDTDYVLAAPGKVYLAYADGGSRLGLLMEAGRYAVKWYDPVGDKWVNEGKRTVAAGEVVFVKPQGLGEEVALYLERM